MKETRSYYGNVYFIKDGEERMKQVFGKQHYEVVAQAIKLSKSLEVHRLMVVSMFYNKNQENYKNVNEHFDFKEGKFILEAKYKDNVL